MFNLKEIKILLTDCDGVLTDGGMYYFEDGNEAKRFNTKDGMGFKLMREYGIKCGIITGEDTLIVKRRAEKLRLDILYQGIDDKKAVLDKICADYGVSYNEIAYVGDDVNDIEVLKCVGLSVCPADANSKVSPHCKYVASTKGGDGVVREVADMLLSR